MRRLGLVGCGAVARCYYAAAIKNVEAAEKLKLVGVFDPDPEAARLFLQDFPGAGAESTLERLLRAGLDQIIIASPPAAHREQAVAALALGIPVHCEKPLAGCVADGLDMIAQARRADTRLSVNMVRRLLAPARSIGAMVQSGTIGTLRSIDIFEGGPFSWPVRSPAYFDPRSGAVGILDDLGTHILDLLCHWLGAPRDLAYGDDAMGGITANCLIETTFGTSETRIRLSRDWHRPNLWTLIGDEGSIVWDRDSDSVEVDASSARRPSSDAANGGYATFEQAFAAPIEAMANGASDGVYVLAADVLPALEAVEACKAVRKQMAMPWLK